MPANLFSGFIALIFAFNLFVPVKPKVLPYARMVVDTLSSPSMHGRGYVEDGHLKAASFIAGEFQRMGLQSFGNGFFQEFEISVNTFPTHAELTVEGAELEAGRDFLVAPCSQTIDGEFPLQLLLKKDILESRALLKRLQESRGKVLLIDQSMFAQASAEEKKKLDETLNFLKHFKNNPSEAVIFLTTDKLTWGMAQQPCETPLLMVKKEVFPDNISGISQVSLRINNKFLPQLTTQNVAGLVQGKDRSKPVLVFSAHYDHLGRLGKNAYFPGANDNASGVAMLLSLAGHYSEAKNQPEQDILFIAFGAEEVGLLGSQYFIKNPLIPLDRIGFLLNLDIAGTGDEGIKVVNGKIFGQEFELLKELNAEHQLLPQVSARGEACNSDHCFFYEAGVPCFFIYTLGGIQAYHDVDDKAATLPLTEFEDLFTLLTLFSNKLELQL